MTLAATIGSILFSSAEVTAVTGLSPVMQRDWRRHKYLSSAGGKRTKADLLEVAEIQIMKSLADCGVGPRTSCHIAEAVAPSVLRFAMDNPKAWDIAGSAEEVAAFADFLSTDEAPSQLMAAMGYPSVDVVRYSVTFQGGRTLLTSDLSSILENDEPIATVHNIEALARNLVRLTPSPPFVVKLQEAAAIPPGPDTLLIGEDDAR